MSRRKFRESVDLPRPSAAIAMVATASVILAITGQLAIWAVALAAVGIGAAALLRKAPLGWQRSGPVLNGSLGAILVGSAWLFARGELAAVALAHFAILTQALQLLDARPRRSEFLLVALSLFQVILAANLTDSVFFPPLLVVFTLATVWTLMVHTLRAEALEAGEPEAARRAISGGLLRMTGIACLLSVLLALLLFPVLPRIRSGVLFSAGATGPLGVAGFSDHVTLGEIGRIRMDPEVVLRVETLEGEPPAPGDRYWRGLAFDQFDGRSWSITPPTRERVPGDSEIGVDLGYRAQGRRLVQRIARQPIDPGVIFTAGAATGIRGLVGRLERDVNGALYAHSTAGERADYTVASDFVVREDDALRGSDAELPDHRGERYLALPELSPEIRQMARQITEGRTSDADRALALETYLRRRGRYSDTPPVVPENNPRSPIEVFLLGETEGHCEYFASAMVVLARSVGLPARLVGGFAGGHSNPVGGFIEVRRSDAHTWVEVHYRDAGWVRYDPTPPDLRLAGAPVASSLAELANALEFWWFRNVVDFDRGHQARALKKAWGTWRDWRKRAGGQREHRPGRRPGGWDLPDPPDWLWGVGALALGLGGLAFDLRRRQRRRGEVPRFYQEALRLLGRKGLVRDPATTARAFASIAREKLSPSAAQSFAVLTESYLAERFGGRPVGAVQAELRTLRDSLRA
jgi:transglutaminase-like putative cysteine protease